MQARPVRTSPRQGGAVLVRRAVKQMKKDRSYDGHRIAFRVVTAAW